MNSGEAIIASKSEDFKMSETNKPDTNGATVEAANRNSKGRVARDDGSGSGSLTGIQTGHKVEPSPPPPEQKHPSRQRKQVFKNGSVRLYHLNPQDYPNDRVKQWRIKRAKIMKRYNEKKKRILMQTAENKNLRADLEARSNKRSLTITTNGTGDLLDAALALMKLHANK